MDEKVEWVWESDEDKPMYGSCRYQHIQLVRGDKMRHFVGEMGPSSNYPLAHPFNFWAGSEYSVGECLEIAERLREGKPPEENEPIDIWASYLRLLEEKQKRRNHASEFGPAIRKLR